VQLSIFDLDNTLLKTNLSFKFYLYLYKKKFFNKKSIFDQIYFLIRFKYFNMSLRSLHKLIFNKSLKNKSYDSLISHIDIFLDKYLDRLFYLPAVKKLQEAIANGHYITLFSSSPSFLVKPIADILKINDYKATIYDLDKDNKFIKINLIVDGKKKAEYAQILMKELKITKKQVYVYSDSIDDLDLFNIAENKIAVRPCKKLYKISKSSYWEII
jgi:HAD superfamily hydrolase (TIGR01490 family)